MLRARLPAIRNGLAFGAGLAFGDARVDGCLPPGGLPLGQVHEIAAGGIEAETGTLAAGFAACWLARLPGTRPIIWIAPGHDLHPPGLLAYGLDPARLLLVDSGGDAATLAAMESALRGGAAAAVVGEVGRMAKLAGRRLHLACLAHGSTGFVLRRWPRGVKPAGAADTSAVATRWRLATAPSEDTAGLHEPGLHEPGLHEPGPHEPGPPRWQVALTQARGGRPGAWLMEVLEGDGDAPAALRVVAGLADATPEAGAPATLRRSA